ncbi:HIRAN domain-containing protein [Candidatus Laterigemmans baculatus]|uniref:HIRAN domain-containing protein n=1 Tax=Candidatus Laterigemmans baculatus TaxID=2770505 RepID=UPI0013DCFDB3|nr:HIRAN domain-containing protein [Candidatus Laterigemmans baculatus]
MNFLYVAWHMKEPPPVWGPVGRLDFDGSVYRFRYTRGAQTLPGFQPFDGMPELEQVYESDELFPLFKNRLLPPSRPEFKAYLEWSGLSADESPEPLVVLGRTQGIKQTDAVELFPCPVPDSRGCFINHFFAHGVRYHLPNAGPVLEQLHPGDELQLRPQPLNPKDPNAVAIFAHGTPLGYVPRYLAADVRHLLEECPTNEVRLFVQRVNQDAPMQQRLLCRLRACWPADFQPCRGEEFEPIVAGVPAG